MTDITLWQQVLVTAAGLGLASLVGSVIGLAVKRIPHKWNDVFMGFCAGTMLAAAIVGLILPAVESATATSGWWQVIIGVVLGVALIGVLDGVMPHLHKLTGLDPDRHRADTTTHRILLFVLAIAIHKLPEGMAAGIVFEADNIGAAYSVAISIALQNIPEGMVVVTPLLMIGVGWWRTLAISVSIALLEMAGVVGGFMLGGLSGMFLPGLLGLAGGAMLYVISDEMIPETHAHGFQKPATYALVAGVLAMLFIDSLT